MKTNLLTGIFSLFLAITSFAQDKTTVRANNSDISDNLDLRAVATIFGDAADLEDFERRLNDPESQISNLDLNNDNFVDYLRVIESVEGNEHIIVIQAVLDKDLYQDVASVEVDRDRNNNVQVQVVGDVYMYGDNYIYEPVYVHRPVIYTSFWVTSYRPYCSSWSWNYYPTYYSYWNPFPIFRYRNHITIHINHSHSYHYVNTRRCSYGYNNYHGRRANGYERRYPNRSFSHRNSGYSNRHQLDQNRNIRTRVAGSRELTTTRNSSSVRGNRDHSSTRSNSNTTPRATSSTRDYSSTRSNTNTTPRATSSTRDYSSTRSNTSTTPRSTSRNNASTRSNTNATPRATSSRNNSSVRNNTSSRSNSSSRRNSSSRSNTQSRSTSKQSGNTTSSRGSSSGRGNSSRGDR
ncbi:MULTISPECIES: hypothetical protein [Flavobacterium]|uniref:DUF3300 domain-containing protein n=1 Tax=Flavobacterium jumunjinense TaxID=998845 RepID=A0ABV5GMA8_9FLAO|nr:MULTISPECIES: hypothetical protein [Flavobacterium]